MKKVRYNYALLMDIHFSIGTLQIGSILGKDDSSAELSNSIVEGVKHDIRYYRKRKNECAQVKDIDVSQLKQVFKSYRKMLKNSLKHKIPWYLKPFYSEIVDDLNLIVKELKMLGFKTRSFKKRASRISRFKVLYGCKKNLHDGTSRKKRNTSCRHFLFSKRSNVIHRKEIRVYTYAVEPDFPMQVRTGGKTGCS